MSFAHLHTRPLLDQYIAPMNTFGSYNYQCCDTVLLAFISCPVWLSLLKLKISKWEETERASEYKQESRKKKLRKQDACVKSGTKTEPPHAPTGEPLTRVLANN